MFQIIFTLAVLPWIPVYYFADLAHGVQADGFIQSHPPLVALVERAGHLLGQQADSATVQDREFSKDGLDQDGMQKCFPTETGFSTGFIPVRRPDYHDLKLFAGSSVVLDVESNSLLHYQNGRKQTQIASLTKMMTAILAMEKIPDLNKDVVMIPSEIKLLPGTVVGCPTSTLCNANRLYVGEKVYAIDLLKAMLMNSANDAAYSLAVHIAGSQQAFVDMMNEKARSLGLRDTHFCTASGLEIDGEENQCYSSAYDIARIGATSLQYDEIWKIMRTPEEQVYSTDGKYMHQLKNTDLLLNELPNCLGGKTGFTPLAGKSLLLGVSDPSGKHRIIAVILNDDQRWVEMRELIDWVFSNYEWK
jgi:serine-type D-Ala-D-Ala carboxypeptidase (penicillin-binding protein 5/6)